MCNINGSPVGGVLFFLIIGGKAMIILSVLVIVETLLILHILYKISSLYLKLFKFKEKFKYSIEDMELMTNLSLGVFVGSVVAVIVTVNVYLVATYVASATISFFAMIEYNYKKRYNE